MLDRGLAAAAAFSGSSAFLPLDDGHLAAFDLVNKRRAWVADARLRGRPAVGDGRVYFVNDGAIVALHSADGSAAWRAPYDGRCRLTSPGITDG